MPTSISTVKTAVSFVKTQKSALKKIVTASSMHQLMSADTAQQKSGDSPTIASQLMKKSHNWLRKHLYSNSPIWNSAPNLIQLMEMFDTMV